MKLILIRIIRAIMISLSLILLGLSLAYIIYPEYTGVKYNYDSRLFGRILGAGYLILISISGIFPYKILKKGTSRISSINFLVIMSLFVPIVFFWSYYTTGGKGFPILYGVTTIILLANFWAFRAICKMNNIKEKS